jgi:2-polyprenyl-3-methyl-5-hydroxy-6-metoxy-1,4-benzoquinol methylase
MTNNAVGKWDTMDEFLVFWLENHDMLEGQDRDVFRTYYQNYLKSFSEYNRHHFAEQTRDISAQIRPASSPDLLEVGTGCGTEALWFAYLGARVVTVDMNKERVRVARARKRWLEENMGLKLDIEFVEMSIFDFESEPRFDLVWMEQTYHHVEPRAKLGPKLFSLLRPGGRCHISEVNAWNPLLQIQLLRVRGFRTLTYFVDDDGNTVPYGNERITTPVALRHTLRKAGFEKVSSRNFRMLPNSNPPRAWLKMELALLKVFPVLSSHFNVEAVKG